MKFVCCEGTNGRYELVNLRYVSVVAREKYADGDPCDEIFCNVSYNCGRWIAVAPNRYGKRIFEDAIVDK